ncbi:DUF1772-domain-containing protein [Penicillium chermesinum]|nr:DUF1772-domain-containing protein [Penicillium chermesinum]
MTSYPLGFQIARAVAITGAGWLGGNIASLSLIAAPAMVESFQKDNVPSAQVARQWKNLTPPLAAAVGSAFLYLAWAVRSGTPLFKQTSISQSALFSAAAALCISIVPYTLVVMKKTNDALAMKGSSKSESDSDLVGLLQRWGTLNQLRGVFPTAAAICGLVAAFL